MTTVTEDSLRRKRKCTPIAVVQDVYTCHEIVRWRQADVLDDAHVHFKLWGKAVLDAFAGVIGIFAPLGQVR